MGTGVLRELRTARRLRTCVVVYLWQIYTQPPTFAIFANRKDMPDSYARFLINSLREEFGFNGCPIRIVVRGAKNPFKQRS
jgi:GTP-binding protein